MKTIAVGLGIRRAIIERLRLGIRRAIIERLREHSSDCGDWGTCGGVKEKGRVRL